MTVGMPAARAWGIGAAVAVSLTALAACGDSGATGAAAPSTVTVTATASDTSRPTPTGSTATASPSTTSSATTRGSGNSSSSSGSSNSGALPSNAAGRELTLSDFFNPEESWEEDRYDIADAKQVPGLAATVEYCGNNDYAPELELRLGNNFSRLTFSVGQANDSLDSDQAVSVEVVGNNAQIEIQSVPFNEIRDFTIPVTGVNALKIRMWLDDKVAGCGGAVNVVVTDPLLT